MAVRQFARVSLAIALAHDDAVRQSACLPVVLAHADPIGDRCSLALNCRSAACTATYLYDPRDKLVREVNGHGATTNYTLDPAGNITRELVSGDGAKDVTYAYTGSQLSSVSAGGATQRYWYDPDGNLDCATLSTGTQATCAPGSGGSYSTQVVADYSYDYLDRMTQFRSFVTNGSTSTRDDASDYEYDALDRVAEQTESHGAAGSPRTTLMSYLGLGNAVSRETQHNGDDGGDPLLTTKSYAYDAYGHRIGLTNSPTGGTAASYTYGYDVHGSVSLLLGDTGTATASYGYRAYGAADAELTKGDVNADNPLNAYRYSAKRLDSGSGSIDMGARRFGPDTARFLQRDTFNGATADLGLALDPLTQNRYALASGNPISFVEWDGHMALLDGGGGGGTTPNPTISESTIREGTTSVIHGAEHGLLREADLLLQRGEAAAARFASSAAAASSNSLMRLPGLSSIRAGALRAAGSYSAWGGRALKTVLGGAAQGLGVIGAGAAFVGTAVEQWQEDEGRTDLTSGERVARAGVRGLATAGLSVLGATAFAGACVATGVGALAVGFCAAAESIVGGIAGNFVGEVAADLVTKVDDAGAAVGNAIGGFLDSLEPPSFDFFGG